MSGGNIDREKRKKIKERKKEYNRRRIGRHERKMVRRRIRNAEREKKK